MSLALLLGVSLFGYVTAQFTLVALVLTFRYHRRAGRLTASPSAFPDAGASLGTDADRSPGANAGASLGTDADRSPGANADASPGTSAGASPSSALPPISILVPCEGAEAGLSANLESHLNVPYPAPRQVIFAAPSPTDPSAAIIQGVLNRLAEAPRAGIQAEVVYSDRAPAALNRKMRHLAVAEARACHAILVAADSDTRLETETLATLVGALTADTAHGLSFAPPRFPATGSRGNRLLGFGFAASPHAFHTLAALSEFIGQDPPVVGSLMAIRSASLRAAGGYRGLAGHIGDDLELARRVVALGQKVVTAPCTVPCPEPDLSVPALFGKLHRWVTVGGSYAPWRLLSYPLLLAPLPLLTLLTLVPSLGLLRGELPIVTVQDVGLPVSWASTVPNLLSLAWIPLFATYASRLLLAWTVGPALYQRRPQLQDLWLLPVWETLLASAAMLAMVHRQVTWRGRRLLVRPGGRMLSLHEPTRAGVPELPARKGWFGDRVLPPYLRHLVRGNFHGVYARGLSQLEPFQDGHPLIFAANHCSFWDGLLASLLHQRSILHDFYVFMEDEQLRRYRFMTRGGAFSIARGNLRSAVQSLKYAEELLSDPDRAVWIFPQGRWRPADARPIRLEPGVGHLARARGDAWVVPVAFHYTLRDGPRPTAFVELGPPLPPPADAAHVTGWVRDLEQAMTTQLDALRETLAKTPLEQVPEGFVPVLSGRPGVAERWDRFREILGIQARAGDPG